MILSRRASLRLMAGPSLALATGRLFPATSSDFWNTEEPSQWSKDEIRQLITDSPWAKQVTADVKTYVAQSSTGGGRRAGGRISRAGGSSNTSANAPTFSGVVRWMSAKPIILALKWQLPADLAHHYVISVSGLPVIAGHGVGADNTDSYEPLKETTYLKVKRQEPAQPGIIEQDPNDTSTLLFGFLNQFLDFSKAKTALFTTAMGPLDVKAKFDLGRMTYKGELAI